MSSQSPVSIQLALQGGGAKLYCLLGALKAVEELETDGTIKVERIAGTSAGAIAGMLLAARISNQAAQDWFNSQRSEHLGFKKLSKATCIWRGIRGRPLGPTENVEEAVKKLLKLSPLTGPLEEFQHLDTATSSIGQRGIPLKIARTNLEHNRTVVSEKDDKIVGAIAESCAVPFVFRTYHPKKSKNPYVVDGGLGANLPVDYLTADAKDWPIVAIGFPRKSLVFDGVLEYCGALLTVAIDQSVERAKKILGHRAVIELDTALSTFDFGRILPPDDDAKNDFDKAHIRTKERLKEFVNFHRSRETLWGDPWIEAEKDGQYWSGRYLGLMKGLHVIPMQYDGKAPISSLSMQIICEITETGDKKKVLKTQVKQVWILKPNAICHSVSMNIGIPQEAEVHRMNWSARPLTSGGNLGMIYLPYVKTDGDGGKYRPVIVHFNKPLNPDHGPYEIIQTIIGHKLTPNIGVQGEAEPFGVDLGISNLEPISEVKVVLIVPKGLGKPSALATSGVEFDLNLEIVGTPLTETEMAQYIPADRFPANRYEGFGWQLKDVTAAGTIGINFVSKKTLEDVAKDWSEASAGLGNMQVGTSNGKSDRNSVAA